MGNEPKRWNTEGHLLEHHYPNTKQNLKMTFPAHVQITVRNISNGIYITTISTSIGTTRQP